MAHDMAEIVMPIRAVERMTVVCEVLDERNIWNVIALALNTTRHRLPAIARIDVEGTGWCIEPWTPSADQRRIDEDAPFPGIEALLAEIDLYPVLGRRASLAEHLAATDLDRHDLACACAFRVDLVGCQSIGACSVRARFVCDRLARIDHSI